MNGQLWVDQNTVILRTANSVHYTMRDLLVVLQDTRSYITPTTSTHEEISDILGWCDCGYCSHVPNKNPE
jgi:hypothetical protein